MPSHGPRKKVARPLAAQRWGKDATRRLAHLRKRRQQQQQAPPGLHGEEAPPGAAEPFFSPERGLALKASARKADAEPARPSNSQSRGPLAASGLG